MSTELSEYRLMKLKFSSSQSCHHHVPFKAHDVRVEEETKPRDRTLFVANLPPWSTVEAVRRIFQCNGSISSVIFQLQPSVGPPEAKMESEDNIFRSSAFSDPYSLESGFKFAYIVFEKAVGVRNAMTKMDLRREYCVSIESCSVDTGVVRWNSQYNTKIVDVNKVSGEISAFMKEHDEEVALEKKKKEEFEGPDEEGWITVAKPEKKKPKANSSVEGGETKKGKKGRRKKKKVELRNFYSSQIKEEKLSKVQELRKKFEKDKEKIAKMKSDRKFRPF